MSNEHEPQLIESDLSEKRTVDGRTVSIEIYCTDERDWCLEVVDEHGNSIVWSQTFETDAQAFKTFEEDLLREGIEAILDEPKAE